ncbi:MAG: hypothetical protein WDZ30_09810 [Cellvibrionaceae bacterium]
MAIGLTAPVQGEEAVDKPVTNDPIKQLRSTQDNPNAAIMLESIFVGDKEQPAISYFIPWQGVGAPDNLHWNMQEKHDQALGAVDREILLRSIHLYGAMELEKTDRPR